MSTLFCQAQDRRVQNKPYTDLRTFHFGVLVGTHLQDVEFNNVGPQLITLDDGTLLPHDIELWNPEGGCAGRAATQHQLPAACGASDVFRYASFHPSQYHRPHPRGSSYRGASGDEIGIFLHSSRPDLCCSPIQQPSTIPHGGCQSHAQSYLKGRRLFEAQTL